MQARKTFLFYSDFPWTKKDGMEDVDSPMGCFDGCSDYIIYLVTRPHDIYHML